MPMDVSTAALGNPRISHSQDSSQAFILPRLHQTCPHSSIAGHASRKNNAVDRGVNLAIGSVNHVQVDKNRRVGDPAHIMAILSQPMLERSGQDGSEALKWHPLPNVMT